MMGKVIVETRFDKRGTSIYTSKRVLDEMGLPTERNVILAADV